MAIDDYDKAKASEQKEQEEFDTGNATPTTGADSNVGGQGSVFYFGAHDTPAHLDAWADAAAKNKSAKKSGED
eukprot:241203-Karenia_brevis.AAC.1